MVMEYFHCNRSFRSNLIMFALVFGCFMIQPTDGLNVPLNELNLGTFQCFRAPTCTFGLEYCNITEGQCRPCTSDICASRGQNDFPEQCTLNCTIADAMLREADTDLQKTSWNFVRLACFFLAVCLTGMFLRNNIIKRTRVPTDEESSCMKQDASEDPCCMGKVCETKEEDTTNKAIRGAPESKITDFIIPQTSKLDLKYSKIPIVNKDEKADLVGDVTCSRLPSVIKPFETVSPDTALLLE